MPRAKPQPRVSALKAPRFSPAAADAIGHGSSFEDPKTDANAHGPKNGLPPTFP
jgi:hypothetical protein